MRLYTTIAVLAFTGAAGASVTQYYGAQIGNVLGTAEFNGLSSEGSFGGNPWVEGGMEFTITNDDVGNYSGCGGDGNAFYSNGGGGSPTRIVRNGGGNFGALEFQFGDGWGQCTNYGYAEAYLGGNLQGGFDIDGSANTTIVGFSGTFDELRVAFFNNPSDRSQHNFGVFNAGLIDSVNWGGTVPAPGAAGLLGLAGLAAGRRRR
jgi:MYXO-CTERM domain-containing protein